MQRREAWGDGCGWVTWPNFQRRLLDCRGLREIGRNANACAELGRGPSAWGLVPLWPVGRVA